MSKRHLTRGNEKWVMVYRSLWPRDGNCDLYFNDWRWALHITGQGQESEFVERTVSQVIHFVQSEALVPDDRMPHLEHFERPFGEFYDMAIDQSKEIAFILKSDCSFPVRLPNGQLTSFNVEGWTLLEIFDEGPEGEVLRNPYSAIKRHIYLFEWNRGPAPRWVKIKRGRPSEATPMSATEIAECLFSANLALPESVQEWLERAELPEASLAEWFEPHSDGGVGSRKGDVESPLGEGGGERRRMPSAATSSEAPRCSISPTVSKEPLLVAALLKHHEYDQYGNDFSVGNYDAIKVRTLAEIANVSTSTASAFFKRHFGGHKQYKASCNTETVRVALAQLAGDSLFRHLRS